MGRVFIAAALLCRAVSGWATGADLEELTLALKTGEFDQKVVTAWGDHRFGISTPRWLDTGVDVAEGDWFTLFTAGELDVGIGHALEARNVIWYRIGDAGRPTNIASNNESLTAQVAGRLFLTMRPSDYYWEDEIGSYSESMAEGVPTPVDMHVVTVAWRDSALAGIGVLQGAGLASAHAAAGDFARAKSLPPGFEYFWNLGRANVFDAWRDSSRHGIYAETSADAGIVKIPVDLPLTDDAQISFDWRYQTLPALGPETEAGFHDYVSIAVEFDNGQDITWFWSQSLEPETSFHCPLPWWDTRETHIVLQSGKAGLGEWHSHTRSLKADYLKAVGGEAPGRIVSVWFIVNSIFGRQPAEAFFADVVVSAGGREIRVFGPDAEAGNLAHRD